MLKTINYIKNGTEQYTFDNLSEKKKEEIGNLLNKQGLQELKRQTAEEKVLYKEKSHENNNKERTVRTI